MSPDTGLFNYTPPELPAGFSWPAKGPTRGTCRSCGAIVWWAIGTKSQKWSPMDHVQNPEDRRPTISHFATCPKADRHRKGARGGDR